MTISTERYIHKPVDAIRVTNENIEQIAVWCHGTIKINTDYGWNVYDNGRKYINLEVSHPTGRRTAKAFPGDWIVTVKGSFKVYNNRAFETTFDLLKERDPEQVQMYLMVTIMDTMQMMLSEELSEDEKTTQLSEIVEKGTRQILDVL